MIQLTASGSNGEIFLDLYEQDPIKLNFNIEDVLDVAVKSEFSRQFRVPATLKNTNFFQSVFEVNGQDFDVTQRRQARILIGGAEFRIGEIRLQKIYKDELSGKIDYEVVFLGSTKNLGSEIGNKVINDLDLSSYIHEINYENVSGSWAAYPEGGLTDGLFNGDIIYPLVDFGNTYGDVIGGPAGTFGVEQTRIAFGSGIHFVNAGWPILPTRFRPMMRIKTLLTKIFEEAGYTYTSNFFDSNESQQMYLSAWGDDAIVDLNGSNANLGKIRRGPGNNLSYDFPPNTDFYTIIDADYNSNFVVQPNEGIRYYEIPEDGSYTFLVKWIYGFTFKGTNGNLIINWTDGTFGVGWRITNSITPGNPPFAEIEVDEGSGFFSVGSATGTSYEQGADQINYVNVEAIYEHTDTYTAGTLVDVRHFIGGIVGTSGGGDYDFVASTLLANSSVEVTEAPGEFTIQQGFNSDYKQLDFIKDIMKMFRLVLIPDPNNPSNFIIEPWQFYIGKGELKDWTEKIDLSKDIVIEPLINEQTDKLTIAMAEDEDWLNKLNQDQFKETFGTVVIDSPYDILDGERKIEIGIAPTPATQLQGYFGDSPNWDDILIPQICTQETENDITVFKPVKAKPRILYYNGMKPSGQWWVTSGSFGSFVAQEQNEIPLVSYYSSFPPQPNTKVLTFQKENGYDQVGNINKLYGTDLYTRYWSEYVELIYNKESRRLTAYFVLDDYDLVNFKYSDVIFVKDTYFYIEKIYDAPLGKRDKIKVDLIKLPNYRPNVGGFVPVGEYWEDITQNWEAIATLWEQL